MTLTGHWKRIDERVRELWPRNVLEQEKQKLHERREVYRAKVNAHISNGGSIDRGHNWAFEFIVWQSLTEIQQKIDAIDILEGRTPEASRIAG